MSASSRVCPQERAVWRFDARGGYPWGWCKSGRIWARFGATFLSLKRLTEWSKWALGAVATECPKWPHSKAVTEWTKCPLGQGTIKATFCRFDWIKTSKWGLDFRELMICRDQRLKMRRWKGALCLKSSPHNEDLIHIKGKDQTLKMRFWFSAVQDSQGSRPQNEALKKDACPHFEGMKFGRSLFGTAFTYEKISLCFVFSMCHEARCALGLRLKNLSKERKNKWTHNKILPS